MGGSNRLHPETIYFHPTYEMTRPPRKGPKTIEQRMLAEPRRGFYINLPMISGISSLVVIIGASITLINGVSELKLKVDTALVNIATLQSSVQKQAETGNDVQVRLREQDVKAEDNDKWKIEATKRLDQMDSELKDLYSQLSTTNHRSGSGRQ